MVGVLVDDLFYFFDVVDVVVVLVLFFVLDIEVIVGFFNSLLWVFCVYNWSLLVGLVFNCIKLWM